MRNHKVINTTISCQSFFTGPFTGTINFTGRCASTWLYMVQQSQPLLNEATHTRIRHEEARNNLSGVNQ